MKKQFITVLAAAGILTNSIPLAAQSLSNSVFLKHQEEAERAVGKGLDFITASQQSDGSFGNGYGSSTGIVALAGMAFLSKGYTPGQGAYSKNLERCIQFILNSQQSNGLLNKGGSGNGAMYSHNISTLFLSECSGMVDPETQDKLDKVLGNATKLILSAQSIKKTQQHQGGWRYKPDSRDSDLSCSGWALMALRSAKLNGAPVPDSAIKSSVEYVLGKQDPKTGSFGYSGRGHSITLTGCGLLCLELSGYHGNETTFKAGDYVLQNHKKIIGNGHELYANYYNAQAMFQLGGKYWEKYAAWMYPHYISTQAANGSWNSKYSPVYGTSMIVLSFSVPYRQLPIYQRDETIDEDS